MSLFAEDTVSTQHPEGDKYLRAKGNCFIGKEGGVQSTSAYFLRWHGKQREKYLLHKGTSLLGTLDLLGLSQGES